MITVWNYDDLVSIGGAAIIGLICGVVMVGSVSFIDKVCKIDDPVGAVSVHGVCGILGTILTGLLATYANGDVPANAGLFYGGGWDFFLVEVLGTFAVAAWAFACGFILFWVIKKIHGIRVSARIEEEGLDIYEHGETAYNS